MKNLLSIIVLSLLTFGPASAQDENSVSYDYISIVVTGRRVMNVHIAQGGEEYKRLQIKRDRGTSWDYRGLFEIINEFEEQGYELHSNTFEVSDESEMNYFLLRRPKDTRIIEGKL